jgi:transmembrane 9 superfamily protein 1
LQKECVFQAGALYFVPVFLTGLAIKVLAGSHLPKYYKWTDVLYFLFGQLAGYIKILIPSGTIGYNLTPELEITCATIGFRAEIPNRQAWYMKTPAQMFLGGLLPFILIFWWMDDIYASLYHLKVCGAFWTMFAVFIFVITLTVLLGMGCTHYQLSKKDHHWWWR